MPLTGALLCLYYSAGVVLVLSSWLRQSAGAPRVKRAARCAGAILAVKLLYLGTNFAWGGMSQGSWAKQMVECLLAASWLTALITIAELYRAARRAPALRIDDNAAYAAVRETATTACSRTSSWKGA